MILLFKLTLWYLNLFINILNIFSYMLSSGKYGSKVNTTSPCSLNLVINCLVLCIQALSILSILFVLLIDSYLLLAIVYQ